MLVQAQAQLLFETIHSWESEGCCLWNHLAVEQFFLGHFCGRKKEVGVVLGRCLLNGQILNSWEEYGELIYFTIELKAI